MKQDALSDATRESPVEETDGINVHSQSIQGLSETEVRISLDDLPDEIRELDDFEDWVEHVVSLHIYMWLPRVDGSKEVDLHIERIEEEENSHFANENYIRYSVWTKFSTSPLND